MNSITASIVLLLSTIAQVFGGSCPPADQIKPCICVDNSIKCFGYNHDIDLEGIFETIAHGHNPGDQFFETFELTSNQIEELPADVFQGVVFRQLTLNFNPKLKCVHPRAFTGMEKITTRIIATNTDFSQRDKNCDIFLAMSSLNILEIINITGSGITEIPEKAFHGRGGPQNNLNWINFSSGQGGMITKIGRNAFSELRNIRYIDVSFHLISTIETFAFAFTEPSDNELKIVLEHNWDNSKKVGLTGESFGSSAFLMGNRRATLKLGANPGLKYLKEDPFHSYLENKANGINRIDLQGTYLDYYWENEWIVENRALLNLIEKITNARTVDGEEIWTVSKKLFSLTPTIPPTTLSSNSSIKSNSSTTPNGTHFEEDYY